MDNQFLSVPGNRTTVKTLTRDILARVEPDEVEASLILMDPLVEMVSQDEVPAAEVSDEAGGFGGSDLLVLVVVPLVVDILGNLLTKWGEMELEKLRERLKQEKEAKALIRVTTGDLQAVIARTKSLRALERTGELIDATNEVIADYFGIK
jgi:hypothetical protein